ncbi:putative U3 small nucleolar ribonucleoprotein MPP10 [Giardia duodenalis]|uniref:U3 small nucleolar ribonucleoprotein MPP10 n=1 Tax=Giardia intestinalis (strain ATCC 50803 / WB clone C6) TaxID=184922 RepID=A8BAI4_GIAIC|nr:putative U3 small nucleolar ribonucleoprotein MPP10 [Giardia intestinalis]KAE8303494.1 putative U3 small nucleolar ribonucleoprotein MPP10 [Giardia intestinalis]|eukprot:XP_001708407.1 U3 small nucleolar ribonucleoprotein protein MPP10, putative [Giardia lamblia ATCC 50803]
MQQDLPSIDLPLVQRIRDSKAMHQQDTAALLNALHAFHDYAVSFSIAPQPLYIEDLHLEQIWEQMETNYMGLPEKEEEMEAGDEETDNIGGSDLETVEELEEADDEEMTYSSEQEEDLWQENMTEAQARAIEAEIRAADDYQDEEESEEEDEENEDTKLAVDGLDDELYVKEPNIKQTEPRKPDVYSDFELARMRLQATIKRIEDDMMNRPTWDMAGEISAHQRPTDALLRKIDDIDFDVKQRPRIQLSEELNENIEKLISIRCRDELFDDPIYVNADSKKERREVVISDARSHKSLGDDIRDAGVDKIGALRDGELDNGPAAMEKERLGDVLITGSNATSDAIRAKEDECYSFFAELERDLHAYTSFYSTAVK